MFFKTIRERLKIMPIATQVVIYCDKYDCVLFGDSVENLERELPQALLDSKIKSIVTNRNNVTLIVD